MVRTICSVSISVVPRRRRPAGEQVVEDGAERIDVRGRADLARSCRGLFGRHVGRRAEHDPGRRVWFWSCSSIRLARPKSVSLGVPSAVSRTLAGLRSRWMMCCSWAWWTARASSSTRRGGLRRDLRRPLELLLQAAAFQVLQGEIGLTGMFADLKDLHDVRMTQPGHRLGLDAEPIQRRRGRPALREGSS